MHGGFSHLVAPAEYYMPNLQNATRLNWGWQQAESVWALLARRSLQPAKQTFWLCHLLLLTPYIPFLQSNGWTLHLILLPVRDAAVPSALVVKFALKLAPIYRSLQMVTARRSTTLR